MAKETKQEATPQRGRFREFRAPTLQETARKVVVDENEVNGVRNGVIHDVLVLGNDARGMGVYPKHVQEAAVAKYDGKPTYVNHTKDGSNPDYLKKLGVHRNPRMTPDGIRTDFHFNANHAAASQLIWDATNAPKTLGFSHDADCTWHWDNGKRVVDSVDSVYGVDLVSKGGTVRGLFEDEVIEGDEATQAFAVSGLSAIDNARSIVLDSETPVEKRRERLIEAVVTLHGELLEGEIADEIKQDETRRKLRKINDTANDMICRAMWDDEFPTVEKKKERILSVLSDWESELNALSGTNLKEEEVVMAIDWKEVSVEGLTKERPDLVATLTKTDEKSRLTEEVTTLKASIETKDKELAVLKASETKRLKEERLVAALKQHNFPVADEVACSLRFKEQCLSAEETEWEAIITDRMAVIGKGRVQESASATPFAELKPPTQQQSAANPAFNHLFGGK